MDPLLSTLTGLAGTLLGGLIGFLSASWLSGKNNKRTAGAKLRAAFAPELALVRATPQGARKSIQEIWDTDGVDSVDQVLRRAFERHATAIEEHRFFVKKHDRQGYQEAWERYYLVGGSVRFHDYVMDKNGHEVFCKRVEDIFRYTEV